MQDRINWQTRTRWFLIAIALVAGGLFYAGFWFPDAYTLSRGSLPRVVLLALRCGLPLMVLFIIALVYGIRSGKIRAGAAGVLGITTCLCILAAYPLCNALYENPYRRNLQDYHPYLQLKPRDYTARPPAAGSKPYVIMCLGGSTTDFVDSLGRDWPSRLEERLRTAAGSRGVEVHNLGRMWYTTLHTLINYEVNLRPVKPDLIIIMQSINDLLHNADFSLFSHGAFRDDYGHFYGPVNRLIQQQGLAQRLLEILPGLWYARPRIQVDTDQFPGISVYERNLRTILDLARLDGTRVALMTEPYLFKDSMTPQEMSVLRLINVEALNRQKAWSLATAKRGMDRYNDVMRRMATECGLVLIDLEKAIPKTLDYFWDDVHYCDRTFDLIADHVAGRLRESGIFTAAATSLQSTSAPVLPAHGRKPR